MFTDSALADDHSNALNQYFSILLSELTRTDYQQPGVLGIHEGGSVTTCNASRDTSTQTSQAMGHIGTDSAE